MQQWIETLEAYPAWQRYLVVGVITIIIVVAFYYLEYKPAVEEIARYDKQIQKLEAKINKGIAMKDKLEEFRKEVFQLKEKMRLAAEVLGNRPNVDLLVKSMETIALQCGLRVEKFQPLPERKKGFYGEIPISLQLSGGFHELGFFFDEIASAARIMNVSNLQITGTKRSKKSISTTCHLTAFWYLQNQ